MNNDKIPTRAVMGFCDREGEDWGELRALQLSSAHKSCDLRMGLLTLTCLLAALAFMRILPAPLIISWVVLSCSVAIGNSVLRRKGSAPSGHKAEVKQVWAIVGQTAALGLCWVLTVPIVLFFAAEPDTVFFGLELAKSFSLIAMLVVATFLARLPIAALVFNLIVASPIAVVYIFLGYPFLGTGFAAIALAVSYIAARNGIAQLTLETAEQRLRDKSETVSLLLREFEDSGADWLWQTDTGRVLVHVSPRFAHALGRDIKEIEGKPLLQIVAGDAWKSGDYPKELHDFAENLKRREAFANMTIPVRLGGRDHWWELSASPRYSEEGEFLGFRGVGSDVTEQLVSHKKISHLARFDTLTSLPNRLQITEALSAALAESEKWGARCAFMMIDLDRFKQVNDTLGHQVGDRLLARVAHRLNQVMSPNELCGRLGGDEFAIVLNEASDEHYIDDLANAIISRVSQPYEIDQHTIYIGASIGSAIGPRDGKSVEMLMRSADLALYHSKEVGRGIHNYYQPKLHAQAEERRLMEIELRKALEQEELHLVYQPVVDSKDERLISFEALLRWKNDRFGDVSPARFIPIAEDANLIVPIGAWALRQACADAAAWPSHIRVSVNVSAEQLMTRHFIETVVRSLRDSGLLAERLEIEVTESLFLRDDGMTAQMLDQIRALGIKLSLDDFGTGYSSLGYLRKTRFDTIKVDKSFVQGAARNVPESLAIIRAVIAMADSLEISTTAEGVETEDELELIRRLGCSKIQGYLFGRPMAFSSTMALFQQHDVPKDRELYRKVALGE